MSPEAYILLCLAILIAKAWHAGRRRDNDSQ